MTYWDFHLSTRRIVNTRWQPGLHQLLTAGVSAEDTISQFLRFYQNQKHTSYAAILVAD